MNGMHWGVRVVHATNSQICGSATLWLRSGKLIEFTFRPDGMTLTVDNQRRDIGHDRQQIIDLLPANEGWTWDMLLTAISFWASGFEAGRLAEPIETRKRKKARS